MSGAFVFICTMYAFSTVLHYILKIIYNFVYVCLSIIRKREMWPWWRGSSESLISSPKLAFDKDVINFWKKSYM